MSWTRVTDEMDENRKLRRLSHEAFRLYWCATTWSRRHRTGGRLHLDDVRAICASQRIRRPAAAVTELLSVPYDHETGCWTEVERQVYEIHDFAEYGPPSSVERVRRHREQKRAGNAADTVIEPLRNAPGNAAVTVTSRARRDPVPEPVGDLSPQATSGRQSPREVTADGLTTEDPDVQAYVERWMQHAGQPSALDLEFFRRVPYECDRLARQTVLEEIERLADRFLGKSKPMPPANYLAGRLGDLQAAASDSGVRPRARSGMTRLGEVLGNA